MKSLGTTIALTHGLLFLVFSSQLSLAQGKDTLSVLHYNLLNFGNYTSYCTTSNNNINDKDTYLKTIIDYTLPDIFTVNEVASNSIYRERIKQNILNASGRTKYEAAPYSNETSSNLVSLLFYNSDKLGFERLFSINKSTNGGSLTRDIILYRLYHINDALENGDTIFLQVAVAHLKAGSNANNKALRADETAAFMNFIENNNLKGNTIFAGDLNVQSSNEDSYQNLISAAANIYRFYDPINTPGSWNNSSSYTAVHTQSTHYSGGCASGGGLDDRFDQILINEFVENDSDRVKYIEDSYRAVGNDGQHFNSSINFNGNNSVPSAVLSALYNMSDHLPVELKLSVNLPNSTTVEAARKLSEPSFYWDNQGILSTHQTDITWILFDMQGRQQATQNSAALTSSLPAGIYLLHWSTIDNSGYKKVWK